MRLGITLGVLITILGIFNACNANRAYKAECEEKEVYVPFQEDSDKPNEYRVCFSKTGDSKEYTCPKYLTFNKITRSCTVSFDEGSSMKCTRKGELELSKTSKVCDGYYSPLLRDCVPTAEYICGADRPDCNHPDFQNRMWVDKEDCKSYYECVKDVLVSRKCPSGKIFDAHTQACIHEVEDECKVDSAAGYLVDPETMCKGKVGKFLADPYHCKAYYYCVDESTPYWSTCDPDRYFADGICTTAKPKSCTCEDIDWDKTDKDSVIIPNNSDNSKYYICKNSKLPEEKECPKGSTFDPKKGSCSE
ncbi:unnamed protein product [Hermetia illucens]|uniref:Chitin-binding type-2 domain-containing protein n=1 Tax=Hermetia illucens TaxID=343691 RepID=A0A7R8UGT6_HERIL|nr:unnamed protein product [Hermetia illucens]